MCEEDDSLSLDNQMHLLGLYVDVRRRIPGRRLTVSTKEARMERWRAIVDRDGLNI